MSQPRIQLLIGILVVLLSACTEQPTTPTIAAAALGVPEVVTPPVKEVGPDLPTLFARRDSLAQQFELKQQNLPLPSYYHKAWWARYYIRSEVLLAGVDTNGVVFLIHSYNCTQVGPRKCKDHVADLQVEIGDSTFVLQSDTEIEDSIWCATAAVQRDMIISTGWQCSDYYLLIDQPLLLAHLADGNLQELFYARSCDGTRKTPRMRAGRKDRAALRDCAALGMVLQGIGEGRSTE